MFVRVPLLALLAAFISSPTFVSASPKCSLKTLKGTYIYGATGLKDKTLPFSGTDQSGLGVNMEGGQEIFDGHGRITNTYSDASGQVTVANGTYTVNENCIGFATYNSGDSYTLYTAPNGNEFTWASISNNQKITGREVRVSPALAPRCSLKTLKGTYLYSHMGYRNGLPYFETGKEIYDGKGHLTNVYTDIAGQTVETTGSYTMQNNCIGEATYDDTEDTYVIFMSPAGSEFRYVSLGSSQSNMAVGAEHRVSKNQF